MTNEDIDRDGSFHISEGMTSIGESAFLDCTNLKQIIIPGSVTSIDKKAFMHCEGLEEICILDGVTTISECVFFNCKN